MKNSYYEYDSSLLERMADISVHTHHCDRKTFQHQDSRWVLLSNDGAVVAFWIKEDRGTIIALNDGMDNFHTITTALTNGDVIGEPLAATQSNLLAEFAGLTRG